MKKLMRKNLNTKEMEVLLKDIIKKKSRKTFVITRDSLIREIRNRYTFGSLVTINRHASGDFQLFHTMDFALTNLKNNNTIYSVGRGSYVLNPFAK